MRTGTSGAPVGPGMLRFSTLTRSSLGHSPKVAASISAIHLRAATGSLGLLLKKGLIWMKPVRNSGSIDAMYCSIFMWDLLGGAQGLQKLNSSLAMKIMQPKGTTLP